MSGREHKTFIMHGISSSHFLPSIFALKTKFTLQKLGLVIEGVDVDKYQEENILQ
jgi:hypothetical protein